MTALLVAALPLLALPLPVDGAPGARNANPRVAGTTPLSIEMVQPLRFGKVLPGQVTSARVVIRADSGSKTVHGGALDLGGRHTRGEYLVRGMPYARFSVRLPSEVALTGTKGRLLLSDFTVSPEPWGVIGASGEAIVYVGATLTLGSTGVTGAFTGYLPVAIESLER